MSTISVGTTLTTGLIFSSDTNGNLVIKTGPSGVTSATFESGGTAVITNITATTLGATSASITTLTGTTITGTTVSDNTGNLRNIPSAGTAKTSAYTLTVSDVGDFVTVGSGGSITVPNDTFAAGNAISVYNDTTGNVSINCPITTAYVAGTNTDRASITLSTRGIATILFINPSLCIAAGNVL